MSILHIANPRPQDHEFYFPVPGLPVQRSIKIPAGQQVALPLDLRPEHIDVIVAHNALFGMHAVEELDRARESVSLIYSIDKKIPIDKISRTFKRNKEFQNAVGQQQREAAAIQFAEEIQNDANNMRAGAKLESFSIDITEESGLRPKSSFDEPPKNALESTNIKVVMDERRAREMAESGARQTAPGRGQSRRRA